MGHLLARLASISLLYFLGWSVAIAETRIALVIGNSGYEKISRLRNPSNDAQLIATTLRQVGFEVVAVTDTDRNGMVDAVKSFSAQLLQAGPDSVGLFYYAGHGVQSTGTNYLVPLQADIDKVSDLEVEAIDAKWVLRQMEAARNGLNIVIFDACRNNPFPGEFRTSFRGLRRIAPPSGSLIAYSAAPGQVAADGRTENSPYASALAHEIRQPGSELMRVFRNTRVTVERQTDPKQTPWEEQSVKGEFYFVPPESPVGTASAKFLVQFGFFKNPDNARAHVVHLESLGLKNLEVRKGGSFRSLDRDGNYVIFLPASDKDIITFLRLVKEKGLEIDEDYLLKPRD